ncbi:MAG: hypothetical protein HYY08_00015 [Firmicutes bacterium]|nr:hypothetical protein [Bacillota bacterium]
MSAEWIDRGCFRTGCSHSFADDQALGTGERNVLDEAPTRFIKPATDLRHAIDIAVTQVRGKLSGYECGQKGLGMSGISPKVSEQDV